mgnify:CR=1 FL=1|tara:strand:- start:92 stop:298 length:207 start_codon:yes stop_codon:yes gene_type:complete
MQAVVNPFLSKHIRYAKPNDFESLKGNNEFMNILEMISDNRKSGLLKYKTTMESIETIISKIDADISS